MNETCPACGHAASSHPRDERGERTCSRSLNDLPSCRECAAPMAHLVERKANTIHVDGAPYVHVEAPMSTRPQDWAEPARSILFDEARRAMQRDTCRH